MRLTTLLVLVGTVAGTVVGHAAQQPTMITSGQQGMPAMIGDFPGLQGAGSKPIEVGSSLILGRVVDGVEGSGVGGAIVTLTLAGFTPVRVQADGEGRFVFRSLPKGTFSIATSRAGYVDGAAGRTRPGGAARGVTLTDDQRMGDVEIPMWKYAAIAGVVLDENNEPLVGAQIRVLRRDYVAGKRRLTMGATDTTDDRGYYRIGSLEAGEYVVALPMIHRPSMESMLGGIREALPAAPGGGGGTMMAVRVEATASSVVGGSPIVISSMDGTVPPAGTNEEGQPLTYQTEFYTGAVAASRATAVTLTPGEERTGLDFKLTPVRALSVSGTAIGPEGPMANVQLQLFPADADELVSPIETATANTDGDGNFSFAMVPTGAYSLRAIRQARGGGGESFSFTSTSGSAIQSVTVRTLDRSAASAPLPEAPTLWADINVGVGGKDITDLAVNLRPGLTVSGSVLFQGAATQPTPEQRASLSINLEPADGRTAGITAIVRGRVDAGGTFTTMGVPAGKYILRVSGAPQGWSLRDAIHNGKDVTSVAIELDGENATGVVLAFTDKPTELNGTVRDATGNADARASVIVFPADRTAWVDTGSQPRRLRQVRAGQDGTYKLAGLPSGDYFVIAVDDATTPSWQDPAFLAVMTKTATQVRLTEGEVRTQALTTTKGVR
jgi:Carboxypeptidase regulatory-like domain